MASDGPSTKPGGLQRGSVATRLRVPPEPTLPPENAGFPHGAAGRVPGTCSTGPWWALPRKDGEMGRYPLWGPLVSTYLLS